MSKLIILMADDDRDILTTNKILLSDSFEIEIASSVEEAKEIARKSNFDAAVIDLNLKANLMMELHLLTSFQDEKPLTPLIVLV